MSDRGVVGAASEDLADLLKTRMPFGAASVPSLVVFFGLFLPVASAARFPLSLDLAVGALLPATSTAVFAIERRVAGTHPVGAAVQLRELVGIAVAAALVLWAILRLPFAALPRSGEFWAAMLSVALVFFFSASLRRRLARREFFIASLVRMSERETPERGTIAGVTRELSVEAGEAADAIQTIRRWLIVAILWFIALLIVTGWGLGIAGTVEQIGVCISTVAVLAAVTSMGRLTEEQHLLTLGLVPKRETRPLQQGLGAVFFAAAALLATAVSLHRAVISQGALAAFAAWIAYLLSLIHPPAPRPFAPPSVPRPMPQPPPDFAERLHSLAPMHGSELIGKILVYIGWTVAAVAAGAFLWLLLAPLFGIHRRAGRPAGGLRSIGAALLKRLREWAAGVRDVLASLSSPQGQALRSSSPLTLRPHARGRRRRARRIVRALFGGSERRFSGAFRRLASWGSERGAPFMTSLGPQEYAAILASCAPFARTKLERIAELYERQLFAPEQLSSRELSEYFKTIKEVVSNGRA